MSVMKISKLLKSRVLLLGYDGDHIHVIIADSQRIHSEKRYEREQGLSTILEFGKSNGCRGVLILECGDLQEVEVH
ncbi:MAG: hypothetical protein ACRC37_01060, partial [Lentisphaeria bacterium]